MVIRSGVTVEKPFLEVNALNVQVEDSRSSRRSCDVIDPDHDFIRDGDNCVDDFVLPLFAESAS